MMSVPSWLTRAQAENWLPPQWGADHEAEPSPFLTGLVMLGAVLCSIPLLAFIVIGLGKVLLDTAAAYVVGVGMVVGALWWLRKTRHIFATCIALEVWGLGLALVVLKLMDDTGGGLASSLTVSAMLLVALMGSAVLTPVLWVCRIIGLALAPIALATFALALNVVALPDLAMQALYPLFPLLGALAWMAWCWHEARWIGRAQAAQWAAVADGSAIGILVCALASGDWMPWSWRAGMNDMPVWWEAVFIGVRSLAVFLVLLSGWLLRKRWLHSRLAPGAASVAESPPAASRQWPRLLLLCTLALAVGAWFSPLLAAGVMVAAAAAASARWRLLVVCGLVALGLLSRFYYQLDWPLAAKGIGLMVLGLSLGLAIWGLSGRSATRGAPHEASHGISRRHWVAVVLGGVFALGVANTDVWRKEGILNEGQRVLIPLAPVDPRSLMQGDYMQLRFEIPPAILEGVAQSHALAGLTRTQVVAELGADGHARLLRLVGDDEHLKPSEIILPLKYLKGQWVLVTDAYFFEEGQGDRFAQARYGEFRVVPGRGALLAGLADEQGQTIPVRVQQRAQQ